MPLYALLVIECFVGPILCRFRLIKGTIAAGGEHPATVFQLLLLSNVPRLVSVPTTAMPCTVPLITVAPVALAAAILSP